MERNTINGTQRNKELAKSGKRWCSFHGCPHVLSEFYASAERPSLCKTAQAARQRFRKQRKKSFPDEETVVSRNRRLAEVGKRWCSVGRDGLGHEELQENFCTSDNKTKGGYEAYCKPCTPVIGHSRRYGVSLEEAWVWFDNKPCCGICGSYQNVQQDHNHATTELRGGLCATHNKGLGLFHDSVTELQAAIDYIWKWG